MGKQSQISCWRSLAAHSWWGFTRLLLKAWLISVYAYVLLTLALHRVSHPSSTQHFYGSRWLFIFICRSHKKTNNNMLVSVCVFFPLLKQILSIRKRECGRRGCGSDNACPLCWIQKCIDCHRLQAWIEIGVVIFGMRKICVELMQHGKWISGKRDKRGPRHISA